ncbi:MAG: hypothetical protein ACE5HV_17715 [Acidobacteriota bacterium]
MATFVFDRPWSLFNYLAPLDKVAGFTSLSRDDALFLGTMLAIALPFIWIGVVLTLKRLRAVRLPTWLVALFFVPIINLVFFALLSVLPSYQGKDSEISAREGRAKAFLDRILPDHPVGSAAMALLLILPFGVAATGLGTSVFFQYGMSLFVGLPFCLGFAAVLLYGYHRPQSYPSCLLVSWLSILLTAAALLALAIEGVICLVMAAPMGVILAAVGGSIGYLIQRRPWVKAESATLGLIIALTVPALMGAEYVSSPEPPLFTVQTAIEIDSPPEQVWQHLVSFAELPKPEDWVFRLGIAYPIRAEIEGEGAGAIRRCVFSTGAFVEPIEVWDEPRLLKFSVTQNPPPMQEWTPYREIHPPHLNGFLVSQEGQFLLTPLPEGRTRLEGTTWYQHNMWPAWYWQAWSDFIIHRIHLRVLKYIKRLAELQASSAGRPGYPLSPPEAPRF